MPIRSEDSVLVTGAAGMVGSHVVETLKDYGFKNVHGTHRKECDLMDFRDTKYLFREIRPKHVFHSAACVYGIIGNMNNPSQSYFENTMINTHVVECARRVGVEKFTAMGTGCVYPYPPLTMPLTESDIFMGRPHPSEAGYAHSKLGMLAQLEASTSEMPFAYVVSCNLFGPGDKFDTVNGHVVPALIRKFYEAKRDGTDVVIWGDGSARRDFIYIKDAARYIVNIMDRVNGPINIGTDNVLHIKDIVEALAEIADFPRERIVWDATKPNGVDYRGYDLSRLEAEALSPKWTIKRGLQETWEWYAKEAESHNAILHA